MSKRIPPLGLAIALFFAAAPGRADVWDVGTDNDNDAGTDNELVHGLDQVHDLAAQQSGTVEDVDFYRFEERCNASYDVLLDGITGGVNGPGAPTLDLVDSDGTSVLASSVPVTPFGAAKHLSARCTSTTNGVTHNYRVRVASPACGLTCAGTDQYRIHFRDTTLLLPRFNNTATQTTVLIVQNATEVPVSVAPVAFDATGAVLQPLVAAFIIAPNQAMVLNLASLSSLANHAGSLRLVNDAPYGALAGKATALEPATGFTFDTPLVYHPY